ncbi:hypothetical protein AN958_11341 [Leucoagaricus sp. SymC.cos]|nr:hypothetical protein AN958_11341 [Leucoagaricus sp. SymC.cos]
MFKQPNWYGDSYFDCKCNYSLNIQLESWVVAPYKSPEHEEPDNQKFNECVSRLCICSEHAIGFLKG